MLEGSTTVLPVAQKAAEAFMDSHAGVDIVVRGGGSGVGIASLIDGTVDIANASRAMKDAEVQKAVDKGRCLKLMLSQWMASVLLFILPIVSRC